MGKASDKTDNQFFSRASRLQTGLLAGMVLLFLLLRFFLLLQGTSHIYHPAFDETASGVLACDILKGKLSAPIMAYQYESRSGDSLAEGLLLVPFFAFFGKTAFAVKLFCIFSALATLLLWLFFLKRYAGISATLIFAAFFALAPPMFVRLNLLGTVASHHLINPFMALQLIILFRIFEPGQNKQKLWLWCVFGIIAGFGAYLFYTYFIFNIFCGLYLLCYKKAGINLKRLGFLCTGFILGFLPWIYRLKYSTGSSGYLSSIIRNITLDPWRFVQNFCFNLPHSMGYEYPLRSLGLQSTAFTFMLLFFTGFLLLKGYQNTARSAVAHPIAQLLGGFLAAFPVFFFICLSLSPMKINPFEYWPRIGLFANFGTADLYRYRWLHSLFPFYFAIIAVGATISLHNSAKSSFRKNLARFFLVFFPLLGLTKILLLTSANDRGGLLNYKGYNYDRLVNRFLQDNLKSRANILKGFPPESRPEIYRCLGMRDALLFFNKENRAKAPDRLLDLVPEKQQADYIYGMINAGQNLLENGLPPLFLNVSRKYPRIFYRQWGWRYLGYKYYGLLCNRKKFLAEIGLFEKWIFQNELVSLFESMNTEKSAFFSELATVPGTEKTQAIKGIGLLVGAEMLFDPLHAVDYPLDSRFGKNLGFPLEQAFYSGVGTGFAETLCRFWRRLLPPLSGTSPFYSAGLEREWQRSISLIRKIPAEIQTPVIKGFRNELRRRELPASVRLFIDMKLRSRLAPEPGQA